MMWKWMCGRCEGSELLQGGDHDVDDDSAPFGMVSNFSCPTCDVHVEVYHG